MLRLVCLVTGYAMLGVWKVESIRTFWLENCVAVHSIVVHNCGCGCRLIAEHHREAFKSSPAGVRRFS